MNSKSINALKHHSIKTLRVTIGLTKPKPLPLGISREKSKRKRIWLSRYSNHLRTKTHITHRVKVHTSWQHT